MFTSTFGIPHRLLGTTRPDHDALTLKQRSLLRGLEEALGADGCQVSPDSPCGACEACQRSFNF